MPSMNVRLVITVLVFLGMAAAGVAVTAASSNGGLVLTATKAAATSLTSANLTVVRKNREFPLRMRMTMHPCAVSSCIDI